MLRLRQDAGQYADRAVQQYFRFSGIFYLAQFSPETKTAATAYARRVTLTFLAATRRSSTAIYVGTRRAVRVPETAVSRGDDSPVIRSRAELSDADRMRIGRRLENVSDLHETVVVLVDDREALPVHGDD